MTKNKNAQALGKLGGDTTIKKYPPEHFKEIGRKGALKRWGNKKDELPHLEKNKGLKRI